LARGSNHAKNGIKAGTFGIIVLFFDISLFAQPLFFLAAQSAKAAQQNGSRHSDRHQRIRGHPMHYIAPDLYRA
jgi:hypothetical protein